MNYEYRRWACLHINQDTGKNATWEPCNFGIWHRVLPNVAKGKRWTKHTVGDFSGVHMFIIPYPLASKSPGHEKDIACALNNSNDGSEGIKLKTLWTVWIRTNNETWSIMSLRALKEMHRERKASGWWLLGKDGTNNLGPLRQTGTDMSCPLFQEKQNNRRGGMKRPLGFLSVSDAYCMSITVACRHLSW